MITTKSQLKLLTYTINGAAIEVHKALGPGLLEDVYQQCLAHELQLRRIEFRSEFQVPIDYKGLSTMASLRCDLLIENVLVVELKAVKEILPIHKAQLLTYMNLLEVPKGLLLNFNVVNLYHNGQTTFVNEAYRSLPE